MIWSSEKIRILRLRMGWSQTELARKLNCQPHVVQKWEESDCQADADLQFHLDALRLLEKQAESASNMVLNGALAEVVLEENHVGQIDISIVQKRFEKT